MRIINKLILNICILTSIFTLAPALVLADSATKNAIQCGVNSAASGDCNSQPTGDVNQTIKTIINILSAVVGVVAVIMIIVAGLRFVTSAGNAEGAKSARNTITYAIIGLVVVAFAQIIVHFVLHTVENPPIAPTSSSSSGSSSGGLSGSSGGNNTSGGLSGTSNVPQ